MTHHRFVFELSQETILSFTGEGPNKILVARTIPGNVVGQGLTPNEAIESVNGLIHTSLRRDKDWYAQKVKKMGEADKEKWFQAWTDSVLKTITELGEDYSISWKVSVATPWA
jgi:hypothetical protein